MIRLIYLDLDDVLNVLAPYLLNQLGCEIGVREYDKYPGEKYGYDVVGACNHLLAQDKSLPPVSYTVAEFWNEVDHYMWANAPRSAEFNQIIDLSVELVGRNNVRILTRATAHAQCLSGKFEWMEKNLPSWLARKYLIVGEDCKFVVADKNSFLLDDSNDNVEKFREAGGIAALMPRPWNLARNIRNTKSYVNDIFELLRTYENH